MKRFNSKGFMMMESLIVITFIMTIFTFIYRNAVPLMGEYNRRDDYDDIDSVYAVNLIRNMLLQDGNFSSLTAGILEGTTSYNDITDCSLWSQAGLCEVLKEQLDIVNSTISESGDGKIYVTRYELSRLKSEVEAKTTFGKNTERGIQTYVNYLPRYTTNKVTAGYRLIIIRNIISSTGEIQKYANIEVIR